MNNNKVWAWILTVVVIVAVGVILWLNPLGIRGTKTTEYGNALAEDFPSDFPADPNIVEIVKNQKNQSVVGGMEFVLAYYTTRPSAESLQIISAYALARNLPNIYDGSGTNSENGSEYLYFTAENDAKTEKISVNISTVPDTGGTLSLVEISIKK
jgi:hypothetical protein